MKKGIIIVVLITLSLILFKPPKINASMAPGWASELPALGRADYKSCSGSNTCNTVQTTIVDYFESPTILRSFIAHESWNMDIGNNGYVITTPTGTTKTGYLYQIDYYICSNKVLTADTITPSIYVADYSDSVNPGNTYNLTARAALGTEPIIDGGRTFNSCYKYSGLVVPENDYVWSMFRIRSSNVISDVYLSLIATEVKELGLYTSTLESIIDNSGFATSESVEEVQESVDRVEEAITGDYEYNDTPSEELEGKEELDDLKDKEEELLGNLDFSGAEDIEITIEPETASFIWQIVDSLRGMSGKIVLLITSILGLGIIKMILNR